MLEKPKPNTMNIDHDSFDSVAKFLARENKGVFDNSEQEAKKHMLRMANQYMTNKSPGHTFGTGGYILIKTNYGYVNDEPKIIAAVDQCFTTCENNKHEFGHPLGGNNKRTLSNAMRPVTLKITEQNHEKVEGTVVIDGLTVGTFDITQFQTGTKYINRGNITLEMSNKIHEQLGIAQQFLFRKDRNILLHFWI